MILHQIDGMPVVRPASGDGENGRLEVVGRVTKTTVVKVFVETIGAPGQGSALILTRKGDRQIGP